jgi:Cu(I)/Ag(I) efflux system membrane fusion protein
MRRDFAYFSTAVADLVRDNHLNHAAGLHIFQCPMAPGIGTGRWLQRSSVLKNPFYGSTMLDCGEEVDAPAAPPSASSWEAPEGNRDAPSSLGRPAFATRQGVLS